MKNLLLILIIALLSSSCKKDELESGPLTAGSNQYINNWIYDNMEFYYYWSEELPTKKITTEDPESYFYNLLSPSDRFSWIQGDFDQLLSSLRGVNKEAGYEFILYRDPNSENDIIGQISYIKSNSPAAKLNLQRGDLFDAINTISITIDNYQALLREITENHTLNIRRYDFTSEIFEPLGTISFTTDIVAENPILLDSVYEIGTNKVAYLVYNLFSVGSQEDSQEYLAEMDAVFGSFKSQGINKLIIDLRYNGGGAEAATINLASLVGSNISNQDIFVKRKYSKAFEAALIERYGEIILNKYFVDKAENIGAQLENSEVIILTSSRTASASELLINGLQPYMNVFLIGDQTVGKNVGSTTIYDEDDSENNYGMQPIITQSFNSNNSSDYENGFAPNISTLDNSLRKKQLGDINEIMLASALEYINNLARKDHDSPELNYEKLDLLFSSQELKRNFGTYHIESKKDDLY
ncbi:MAG: carboxyl-terminal processing protease [Psychroserpens sp.]|jgi:carboxyl-terminal processing protease